MKIKATYTIDKDHPDSQYIKDWTEDLVRTYSDTYTCNPEYGYSINDKEEYIKRDLALVAGGGYSSEHIHNVEYTFERSA